MKLKNKKGIAGLIFNPVFLILFIGIIFLVILFLKTSDMLAIVADDYLIEDDFTVPTIGLAGWVDAPKYCSGYCSPEGIIYSANTWDSCSGMLNINNPRRIISAQCEDSKWNTKLTRSFVSSGVWQNNIFVDNGYLVMQSPRDGTETTYIKNVKNKDIKFLVRMSGVGSFHLDYKTPTKRIRAVTLSAQPQEISYLVEIEKSFEDRNNFFVQINGIEKSEFVIEEDEAQLVFGFTGGEGYYGKDFIRGISIYIDYLKSRAYFNCNVENDEAVVRDTFGENSVFDITDLTYEPVKFCIDSYPAVKRSYTEEGIRSDVKGELLKKLARGESIIVGTKESIEINSIVKYKEGMMEKCGVGEVYDLNAKSCKRVVDIAQVKEIIKLIRENIVIQVSKDQKFFADSITIGNKAITSTKPKFFCGSEGDNVAPQPRNECWVTDIEYDGVKHSLANDQEADLNDYLKIKYIAEGKYSQEKGDLAYFKNNFLLTLKNREGITTEAIKGEDKEYFVILNEPREIEFIVNNKLADFTAQQAGYSLIVTKDLIIQQRRELVEQALPIGRNINKLKVDSSELGEIRYEIYQYTKLGNEIFFDNEVLVYNFKVVNEIPKDYIVKIVKEEVVKEKIVEKERQIFVKEEGILSKIWNWFMSLFK